MMTSPACAVTVPRPVCESSCWTSKEEHETSRDPREDARRLDKFTSVVGRASWSGSERCKQIAGAAAAAGADSGSAAAALGRSLAGEIAPRRASAAPTPRRFPAVSRMRRRGAHGPRDRGPRWSPVSSRLGFW